MGTQSTWGVQINLCARLLLILPTYYRMQRALVLVAVLTCMLMVQVNPAAVPAPDAEAQPMKGDFAVNQVITSCGCGTPQGCCKDGDGGQGGEQTLGTVSSTNMVSSFV